MGDSDKTSMTKIPEIVNSRILKLIGFLVFYITISPITIYTSNFIETLSYISLCILLLSLEKKGIFDSKIKTTREFSIFFFFLAFVIPIFIHGETPFVTDFLQWTSLFLIISIKHEYRVIILKYSLKILYIVTLLSIVEYLIGYITGTVYIIANTQNGETEFSQSFFNLYRYGNLRYRFSSLSSEPGELGALCGFIIAFLPFNKKYIRQILVFSIAGIISLSLAFYIYLFTILFFKTATRKLPIKYFIISIFVIAIGLFLFRDAVTTAIIERVSQKDSIESVDNRTGENVNMFIEHIFDSTDAMYGIGNRTAYKLEENSGHGNAGLKWKIFQYGILGVGFYFIGMWILLRKKRNLNVSMTFTILFFSLYFYSVGAWGIPIYILLLFTTLPNNNYLNL